MLVRVEVVMFLAVVDIGTVSGAARRLRCSQPTVTAALQRLEAGLGVAVFDRREGRSPVLTRAGRALLEYGRMAMQLQMLVESHVAEARRGGIDVLLGATVRLTEAS